MPRGEGRDAVELELTDMSRRRKAGAAKWAEQGVSAMTVRDA